MTAVQDVKKIYGQTLHRLMGEKDGIIAVDADLMRIAGTECIRDDFPDRYVNAGIAEQNAVAVAAGLAAMGKTVFISAFSQFLGTRASDQCLDTVCYNQLNVKLIGTYAGITSAINGGTHISLTDIAMFRAMPGMKVMEPADGAEFSWAIGEAARIDGPVYIRIPKGPLHCIFEPGTEFGLGKGHVLSGVKGRGTCRQSAGHKRIAVISSGITTQRAAEAVKILRESGVYVTHIHMGQLKPADDDLLIETAKDHDIIVTLDNHNVIGGLGDVVCQAVSARTPAPAVIRLGIEDVFCEGMKEDQLAERHGISAAAIVRTIRHLL